MLSTLLLLMGVGRLQCCGSHACLRSACLPRLQQRLFSQIVRVPLSSADMSFWLSGLVCALLVAVCLAASDTPFHVHVSLWAALAHFRPIELLTDGCVQCMLCGQLCAAPFFGSLLFSAWGKAGFLALKD